MKKLPLVLPLVLAPVGFVGWYLYTPEPFRPFPTEVWFGEDEGEEQAKNLARQAWIESMHRAPPDVDWRAVERENGLAATARRRGRASTGPGAWIERGSDNQAGRMHGGLVTDDGAHLYGISPLGGVWKGTPEGEDWTPIGDNLYGGAQSIAVLPADGTGDAVVLVTTDSGAVHRTTDDGATWAVPAGLSGFASVRRLARMTDGTDTVFVVGGPNDDAGIWRSTDGGASFSRVYSLGPYAGDLWVPRDGGSTVFAASGDGLLRSEDHGATWSVVGPLPVSGAAAQLVGSEAGAPTLYAVSRSGGYHLYRSDDAGLTWTDVQNLADYYGEVEASIVDPLQVVWGGVELWISEDGGASGEKINGWGDYYGDPANLLHADIMGLNVQLMDGAEIWWIGCDGGLYRSDDHLDSVRNVSLEGLRVGQYYSTLTSTADPLHVALGAQDQGYQVTQGGDTSQERYDFVQALSGDYGHLTSSDGSHSRVLSVYPGLVLIAEGEDNPALDYFYFPSDVTYAWLPPIAADPLDRNVFYFAGDHILRYEKSGRRWDYEVLDQDFAQNGYEYVSAITFAPSDPQKVYVTTNYGRTFHSEDHLASWAEGGGFGADAQYFYGNALAVDPDDADTAWVGGSGYGEPVVFRTTDGGATWEPWADGLPDTMIYSLAVLRDGSDRVFAGGEQGAYMRGPGDAAWTDITDGAPLTTYWSAEIVPGANTARFGTYGRGVWDYAIPDTDADGDGVIAGTDCDDGDETAFPGGIERCGDGVDQDCSGRDLACGDLQANVTDVVAAPPSKTEEEGEEPGGCGCQGVADPSLLAGMLALFAARRRRR